MRYLEFGRDTVMSPIDHTPGAEGLTVADYILYVSPEIYTHHVNTLSSIEFYGATLFENLRQVLISCPKMRELTLTHISLDRYERCPCPSSSRSPPHLPSSSPSSTSENTNNTDENFNNEVALDFISNSNFPIEARHLLTIEFNNDRNITKDELIIVDFLQTHVNLPVLRCLLFNTMTYGFQPKQWVNQVMEMYGQKLSPATLANFLVKCSATLKTFSIRRHEFIFYNNYNNNSKHLAASASNQTMGKFETEFCDTLCLVQLHKVRFQCDTEGIHHLLSAQTSLEKLDCYSHHEETCLNLPDFLRLKRAMEQCVEKSAATLKQAHTIGIIAFPKCQVDDFLALNNSRAIIFPPTNSAAGDAYYSTKMSQARIHRFQEENQSQNEIFVTDLKIFKDCPKLTNLWIAKMDNHSSKRGQQGSCLGRGAAQYDTSLTPIFSQKFTFINSKYLPISLFQLEIWIGHVTPEELIALTLKFREMINLHYFRLTSVTVFTISEECFQNIIGIEDSWIQAHFYNGLLADDFCPQQLLLSGQGQRLNSTRNWEVKISDSGCEFLCRESKTYF